MSERREGYRSTDSGRRDGPVPRADDWDRGRRYDPPHPSSDRGRPHSPRRRYSTPPRDHLESRPSNELKIKGASSQVETDPKDHWDQHAAYDERDDPSRRRSPQPPSGPSAMRHYYDRDRPRSPRRYQSDRRQRQEDYSSRSRSYSRNRWRDRSPDYGDPPSREVLLDNIALSLTEDDVGLPHRLQTRFISISFSETALITRELEEFYDLHDLEDVRLIRDRDTRASRGFAFIKFPALEASRDFVRRNFPTIYLYGSRIHRDDHEAARVRIRFTRPRDEPLDQPRKEWICSFCSYQNFASRSRCKQCQQPLSASQDSAMEHTRSLAPSNNGDSDVAPDGRPSQVLILRGLEPSVNESMLAKGVAKLYKPAAKPSAESTQPKKNNAKVQSTTDDTNLGAPENSLRRVMIARSRSTDESWRYGFAEFSTIDDAQAALTRFLSLDKFTIASKPVMVDYIHAGVFVPVLDDSERASRFSFEHFHQPGSKVAYWDKTAWVAELKLETPAVDGGFDDLKSSNAADTTSAIDNGAVTEGVNSEPKPKKRKADSKEAQKQKKVCITASKPFFQRRLTEQTVPAHLKFWSDRHAELHGSATTTKEEQHDDDEEEEEEEKEEEEEDDIKGEESNTQGDATGKKSTAHSDTPSSHTGMSFANLDKKCCYLCSRQFKTEAEVNVHERLSDLHRKNIDNAELVSKAKAKMKKVGVTPSRPVNQADGTPGYRDRAKERRKAFGTPSTVSSSSSTLNKDRARISLPMKKAPLEDKKQKAQGLGNGSTQTNGQQDEKDEGEDEQPAPSKGAALLGKMGWSAGEALGARGGNKGIVAPIETEMYVEGVGLGAKGGKVGDAVEEAGRQTRGNYGEWISQGKDRARERFEKMD